MAATLNEYDEGQHVNKPRKDECHGPVVAEVILDQVGLISPVLLPAPVSALNMATFGQIFCGRMCPP